MARGDRKQVNVASVLNAIDQMLESVQAHQRAREHENAKMIDQTADEYNYHRARVRRMLQGMLGNRRYVMVDFSGLKW